MKTYTIDIKTDDGCVISRMITFKTDDDFYNFLNEKIRLKSLESLYINDGNDILIVNTDKVRDIVIREV